MKISHVQLISAWALGFAIASDLNEFSGHPVEFGSQTAGAAAEWLGNSWLSTDEVSRREGLGLNGGNWKHVVNKDDGHQQFQYNENFEVVVLNGVFQFFMQTANDAWNWVLKSEGQNPTWSSRHRQSKQLHFLGLEHITASSKASVPEYNTLQRISGISDNEVRQGLQKGWKPREGPDIIGQFEPPAQTLEDIWEQLLEYFPPAMSVNDYLKEQKGPLEGMKLAAVLIGGGKAAGMFDGRNGFDASHSMNIMFAFEKK